MKKKLKNEIANLPEARKLSGRDVASGLYDRLAPRVLGLITQVLSSHEGAEEVLQQVFLRLASEPQILRQEGISAEAWLMLEARAAALDRLYAQQPENNTVNAKASGPSQTKPRGKIAAGEKKSHRPSAPPLNPAWLPEAKVIDRVNGRLGMLHRLVSRLPPEQRKALDLAVFGGRTETEIAAEMGEPLGKVQRSLRAALTFVKHRCRTMNGTWPANI